MTLPALPEMNAPTVTTALLCGDTLRDTIVCNAMTSDEPATTGSMLSSGIDPWLPLPVSSISQLSTAAIIAPSRKCSFPDFEPGHVVHAEHSIDGPALEQPILDHGRTAGHDLLGGLKDQPDGAVEVSRPREILARREQHRRVPVVAAQMRHTGDLALVGQVVVLLDRQRVGIGAQADGLCAVAGGQ